MKLKCRLSDYKVHPPKSGRYSLPAQPTKVSHLYKNKQDYRDLMESFTSELSELQRVLYAHGRYALLLIFQGMDTAGKDGAIRHVMSGVNPQGCQVHSFKQPSSEELAHDYMWRTTKRLPRRGHIGIFNRSYYEEVLVVKALPDALAAQQLPEEFQQTKHFWRDRYADMVQFERYMHRNGTRILKFYLHISKEEQRQRLLARALEPEKNWKISPADLKSRSQWELFQSLYSDCLARTSHKEAPWFCIPADDKRNARLIISHILVETLRKLPLSYPVPDERQMLAVQEVRKVLEKEAPTHD